MLHHRMSVVALSLSGVILLLVLSVDAVSQTPQPAAADSQAGTSKQEELFNERLEVIRQIAQQAKAEFREARGTISEVWDAERMLHEAELEQSQTKEERIAILEQYVAGAKQQEEFARQLIENGRALPGTALKAKADRLRVEIALEQAKAGVGEQVSMAQRQVAIKRAAVKMAEAKKEIADAIVATLKAEVDEARALESIEATESRNKEELAKKNILSSKEVALQRDKLEAAKAHRTAAEGKVKESEARVKLEEARLELSQLEVGEAASQLKHLKTIPENNR